MTEDEAVIPQFSRSDYLTTPKPFEYLYKFRNNKFILTQMKERLSEMAKEVGVSNFKKMWEDYFSTMTCNYKTLVDGVTKYTNQPLELACGDYICEDSVGVAIVDQRSGAEIVVCPHPIIPVMRLVNIDTNTYKMKLLYRRGQYEKSVIVDNSTIGSATRIIELADAGIAVNSNNAKYLGNYLMNIEEMNYEKIPEQVSVGRLGWISPTEFSPYVDELEFDGDVSFGRIFNAVKENGKFEVWLNAMLKLREEDNIAGRLFLAASFASAILEPCGLLPFFLHFWGGTEVGKTVGLMIAASVWASPNGSDYITTFNGTAVGQELQAGFLNSLPMCIDELQIQSSQRIKDFDSMIYQLTEGVGRLRGKKTGGLQKTSTWKNCIITTGEHPISNATSGGGVVNRVLEFECVNKVSSDLVGISEKVKQNYGFAGKMFIDYLHKEGVLDEVKKLQKEYYNKLISKNTTDKQSASASAILTADKIVTDLIFKDGKNLTVDEIKPVLTNKDTVNVNMRALEFIYDLVAINSSHFIAPGFDSMNYSEVWGKVEDDYTYIISTIFDREMSNQNYNPTSFLSWAKRNNLLKCDEEKRNTCRKTMLNSKKPRCIAIKNPVITEETKEKEDEETYCDLPF